MYGAIDNYIVRVHMANLINVIALSNIKSIFVCIVSLGITILCMMCVCVCTFIQGMSLYLLVFTGVCVHQLFRLIYTSIEFVILSLSIPEPAGFHPLHKE